MNEFERVESDSRCECPLQLKAMFAEREVEVNVSPWRPGLQPTGFDYLEEILPMRCRHGVHWHCEPTSEQKLKWKLGGHAGVEQQAAS